MSNLRILGIFLSLLSYLIVFILFKKKKINTANVILIYLFVTFLLIVSIYPNFALIFSFLLNFKKSNNYRLITLLIVSSIFGWFFIFYIIGKITKLRDKFNNFFDQTAINEFEGIYGKGFKFSDIVVVIPAYNEEKNIGLVLSKIPERINNNKVDVLAVVDGGDDNTYDVVKNNNMLAVRTIINRGGGLALRLGYKMAVKYGAKIIVTMDADGQHDPNEIKDIIRPIINKEADFVLGSRVLGSAKNTPFIRRMGIYFFSKIMSIATLTKLTDCSNGFRAVKTDGLNKLLFKEEQYHSPELLIEAARNGLVIKEVPVTVHERLSGESKKGRNYIYGLKFAITILKTFIRGNKR